MTTTLTIPCPACHQPWGATSVPVAPLTEDDDFEGIAFVLERDPRHESCGEQLGIETLGAVD